MFGLSPAWVKIPWIALVGLDVLAQRGDGVVAEHGGVEGVATLVREGGGVGLLAVVVGVEGVDGDHVHARQVLAGRVDHHRRVDAVEGAPLGEEHLAAAALLGRRAEHDDPAAELVGQGAPPPARRRGRRCR